jgi:glucose/arabinose dehydrogenase
MRKCGGHPRHPGNNHVRSVIASLRAVRAISISPALLAPALLFCAGCAQAFEGAQVVATQQARVELTVVTSGLEHPWGIAFLPDGRALVTERPGRLRIVDRSGKVGEPLAGVPVVDAVGQGGLLDVTLDPEFARNQRIYLSYAEPRGDGMNGTSVARAMLGPKGLEDVTVIFRQQPAMASRHHFGSRLVFGRDGNLFVTLGDRNSGRDKVQLLDNHIGKVVRIDRDGKAPADNPYLKQAGALPEIWSIGHRNVQGAALDPATGDLWTNEHGPKGGDELNRTLGGRNYGWPLITYGMEYSGKPISDKTAAPGLESPVHFWVPSIATSGLAFYTGATIPAWKDNVFVGGLKSGELSRLEMRDGKVVSEERLFGEALQKRIRTVVNGPDGALYLLTDEDDGQLIRVTEAK